MHPAQRRHRARNPAAERVRHRLDRQDPPHPHARDHRRRTVRPVADRHGRRILLRLLRPRREPVASAALGEHHADAGAEDAGRGLSPGGRHGRQDHRLDSAAEVDPSRQAVDRLLRPERAQAAGRRAERVHREIPRQVRRRLRQAPRTHPGAAEGAGDRPGRHQARAMAGGAAAVGHAHRHGQEGRRPLDGSLLRRGRAHGLPGRPHRRGHRADGRSRQHAHHLHRRRQRPDARGRPARHHEQAELLQRRPGVARRPGEADRRLRRPEVARLPIPPPGPTPRPRRSPTARW